MTEFRKASKVTVRVSTIGQTTSRGEHLIRTKIVHTQVRRDGKKAIRDGLRDAREK